MTTYQAKKIIRQALEQFGLSYTKLTARTVGFSDLARDSCIFVQIHGFEPSPIWSQLKEIAKCNGFCIES